MKEKSKLQKIAEVTYQKVLKNHEHYFTKSWTKPTLERLKTIKFDKDGNVRKSKYSEILTFSYKTIYIRWQKLFKEAKDYVENRS